MADRIVKNSKLTNRQIGKLIEYFSLEVPALRAAKAMGINLNSADRMYNLIRESIAIESEKECPVSGEVEVDESYFGGKRTGNRGRGASGKVPVFGRGGRVYTRIVNDVSRETLRKIILKKIEPESTVYSDSFRSYDGLVLDGFKHYRINHAAFFCEGIILTG